MYYLQFFYSTRYSQQTQAERKLYYNLSSHLIKYDDDPITRNYSYYKHHLLYMQILKLLQKTLNHADQMMINLILKLIKNTQIALMVIKLYAVMMVSSSNQFNLTEVKMQFINSWKKFWMKYGIVRI